MDEEDEAMGIPEWVVTFGDMMSLLLTFFIMLVSMSEIKQEEKFQAMVESMQKQFGHDKSMESVTPGDHKTRSEAVRTLSTEGRAKKKDTHKGGAPTKAPLGEDERVRIVRPGRDTAIGTVIFFESGTANLTEQSQADLDLEVVELLGKPQKIEIRGHTGQEMADDPARARELGYRRAAAVMNYLMKNHQVEPGRMRCSTAGASEPMHISNDPEKTRLNPRAEVFLLEEMVDDVRGTPEERAKKFVTTNAPE